MEPELTVYKTVHQHIYNAPLPDSWNSRGWSIPQLPYYIFSREQIKNIVYDENVRDLVHVRATSAIMMINRDMIELI